MKELLKGSAQFTREFSIKTTEEIKASWGGKDCLFRQPLLK